MFLHYGGGLGRLLEVHKGKTSVPMINDSHEPLVLKKDFLFGRAVAVDLCTDEDCMLTHEEGLRRQTTLEVSTCEVYDASTAEPITHKNAKVGANVTQPQKQELVKMLNEYRRCFTMNLNELGKTDVTSMMLEEVEQSKPVYSRPYCAHNEREQLRRMVDELKEAGIVGDSISPYASPCRLVKKTANRGRLWTIGGSTNRQKKDCFPLPIIDDQLDRLSGSEFFTTLDLASGYMQVPMEEVVHRQDGIYHARRTLSTSI